MHEPARRWHLQAPQLCCSWMLGWAPQIPFPQLRGHSWWTICMSCSAAAGDLLCTLSLAQFLLWRADEPTPYSLCSLSSRTLPTSHSNSCLQSGQVLLPLPQHWMQA